MAVLHPPRIVSFHFSIYLPLTLTSTYFYLINIEHVYKINKTRSIFCYNNLQFLTRFHINIFDIIFTRDINCVIRLVRKQAFLYMVFNFITIKISKNKFFITILFFPFKFHANKFKITSK